jgi:putative adhesin/cell wall-active antibiotic response 4TMS protein YvqF
VSRRTSAGSIFWGITLVAIGGILLARNLGYAIPIWGAVARYWPVLIIVWGLLKLVDYLRMRNDAEKRPLFSGGEVALLILIIFVGSAITVTANINPNIGSIFDIDGDFDIWDIAGNSYHFTEHQELDATAGATIRIFNVYGSVDVKPADGDRITLDVEKTVRATDQTEADRRVKDFTFAILNEAGTYRVVSSLDEARTRSDNTWEVRIGNDRQRFKSNLTIRVPRKAKLDINNRYGAVAVDGLEGNQTIANRNGSTTINNITGDVSVTTLYASAVLESITGDVTITNSNASTTLRTIGGKVQVTNKYGHVDVQDVKGDAAIENRYSAVNAERIGGRLKIEGRNNSVDIDQVNGSLEVETSYKTLSVRNAKGTMTLSNRHGDVDIELDGQPRSDVTVNAQYSDVTIAMPANSTFQLDGRTRYGNVDSSFDGVSVNTSGREKTVRGQVGQGGPRISIETDHGNIRLEKRG